MKYLRLCTQEEVDVFEYNLDGNTVAHEYDGNTGVYVIKKSESLFELIVVELLDSPVTIEGETYTHRNPSTTIFSGQESAKRAVVEFYNVVRRNKK